jgi:membrane protease YdiL (CAAX protease family)
LASPEDSQSELQPQLGGEPPNTDPSNRDPVLSSVDAAANPSLVTPGPVPSKENPAWNGWDVLAVVGLALITIFVSQLAILFVAHYLFYPQAKLADLAQRSILLLISQFVIDGAVVAYLFLLVEGKYRQPFWRAIRWNWPKSMWAMLALGAATYIGLAMLGSLLPMPKDTPFDKLFQNRRDAYLLAIIATTLGPLMEELFFRGLFYPVVAKRWGAVWGIFLSALPFALMHMQQYGYSWGILLLIFGVGLVCGIVRAVAGSVAASFLVHAGYNGAQMLIAISLTHGFTRMPKGLLECFSG